MTAPAGPKPRPTGFPSISQWRVQPTAGSKACLRAGGSSSRSASPARCGRIRRSAQRPWRGATPTRRGPSRRPSLSAPRENSRMIPKRWSGCASPSTRAASTRSAAWSGSALPCPTAASSPARIGLCLEGKRHESSCGMSAATPLIPSATRAEGARPGQTQEASPAPPWRVSAAAGRTRWTAVCGPRPRAGLVPARRIRSPRCK